MRPIHLALLGSLTLGSAAAVPLPVSATTTIIADIVKNVGGKRVSVNTLIPAGADSHSFQPGTAAMRSLSGSKTLFANGAGLEPWAAKLGATARVPVTELTRGLKLRPAPPEAGHDGHDDHAHEASDPHAWWDADLLGGYVKNVQTTLTRLDPAGKNEYAQNAAQYLAQIKAADTYAKKQFATLPPSRRTIVTNHDALHYLAARYGLKVAGTVLPGLSTEREPSARELAQLIQNVKKSGARVIFTENTVNTRLAQTLASETGARIAPPLFTDALAPAGQPGSTLLQALRLNVDSMVKALR